MSTKTTPKPAYTTDDLRVTRTARVRPYEPIGFPVQRKGKFHHCIDNKTNTVGGDLAAGTWGPNPDLVTEPLVYASAYDLGGRCESIWVQPRIYVRRASEPCGERFAIEVSGVVDAFNEETGWPEASITYWETTLPWDEYVAECDRRIAVAYGPDAVDGAFDELSLQKPVGCEQVGS